MTMVTTLAPTADGTKTKLLDNASPGTLAIIKPFAGAALRHVATAAGVWLVSKGITDSNGAAQGVGAVMTLGGLAWSWYEKYGSTIAKQALADAVDLLHVRALDARARVSSPPSGGTARPTG